MCLAGIAAGVDGKIKIGDVVVSDTIHDATITVLTEKGEMPRIKSIKREELIDRMLKLRPVTKDMFNEELNLVFPEDISVIEKTAREKGLTELNFSTTLEISDGTIVSGNKLLRDSSYFVDLRSFTDERCRAGEMEAAGFARACELEKIPWLVVRGISDFGDPRKDDSFQKLAAYSAATVLKLLIVRSMDFDKLPFGLFQYDEAMLGEAIAHELRQATKSDNWDQAVTIGSFLSRPMWVSGKYELRLYLGHLVEDAAAKCDRPLERSKALIDDLGWTSYKLKDRNSAIKYIKDGLRIATEVNEYYLIAKGNRHLASIFRTEGNFDEAKNYLKKAREGCEKIVTTKDKDEMSAALLNSEAKLLMSESNYEEAIRLVTKAKMDFENQRDNLRAVKTYNLLGKAYSGLENIEKAFELYDQGFKVAQKYGRKDEMLSNATSLSLYFVGAKDKERCKYWLNISISISQDLRDIEEERKLRQLLNEADKKNWQ